MQISRVAMGVLVLDQSQQSQNCGEISSNNVRNSANNNDIIWTPPPKKKWIQHYFLEDSEPATKELQPPPSPSLVTNGGHELSDGLAQDLSDGANQDHSDDNKDWKRTAGTREVHNKLEKNRRAHLKECFELLKKQLPASQEEKKCSNLSILHSALRYIQSLRRKEREYEHEMERLAREKIAAQQRLAVLKKELSAQWDHIDFNALLPEPQPIEDPRALDHVSQSTSTASEREEGLSDPEEPLSKCGVLYSSTSSLSSATTAGSPPQHEAPKMGIAPVPHHHAVQLPVSGHVVSASGLAATLVSPTIQLISSGLRVVPGDPQQPLALTVPHISSTAVSNRLRDCPGTTTAAITLPTLHLGNKMVAGSVALADTARLPGGAELNILPANGALRAAKHPLTLTAGLHGGASLPTHLTHVVTPLGSHHASLAPLTVVSQGSQVAHILATTQQLGKVMTTTPLLKSVGPMPLMSAQYLGTTLVKPVVVVTSPSTLPPPPST